MEGNISANGHHRRGGRKAVSESVEIAICAEIEAGKSRHFIGARYGIHYNTVSNIWRRRKGKPMPTAKWAGESRPGTSDASDASGSTGKDTRGVA